VSQEARTRPVNPKTGGDYSRRKESDSAAAEKKQSLLRQSTEKMLFLCLFHVFLRVFFPLGLGIFLSFFSARASAVLRYVAGSILCVFALSLLSGGRLLNPYLYVIAIIIGGIAGIIVFADPFREDFKTDLRKDPGVLEKLEITTRPGDQDGESFELQSPTGEFGPGQGGNTANLYSPRPSGGTRPSGVSSRTSGRSSGGLGSSGHVADRENPSIMNFLANRNHIFAKYESKLASELLIPGILGIIVIECACQFLSLVQHKGFDHGASHRHPMWNAVGFLAAVFLVRPFYETKYFLTAIGSFIGCFMLMAAAVEAGELYVEPGQRNSVDLLQNFMFIRTPNVSAYEIMMADTGKEASGSIGAGSVGPDGSPMGPAGGSVTGNAPLLAAEADGLGTKISDEAADAHIPDAVKHHIPTFILISIVGPAKFLMWFDMDAPFLYVGIIWKVFSLLVFQSLYAQSVIIKEREEEGKMDVSNLLGNAQAGLNNKVGPGEMGDVTGGGGPSRGRTMHLDPRAIMQQQFGGNSRSPSASSRGSNREGEGYDDGNRGEEYDENQFLLQDPTESEGTRVRRDPHEWLN